MWRLDTALSTPARLGEVAKVALVEGVGWVRVDWRGHQCVSVFLKASAKSPLATPMRTGLSKTIASRRYLDGQGFWRLHSRAVNGGKVGHGYLFMCRKVR